MHRHVDACPHTCMHVHMHACTHSCLHSRVHAHICTCANTHTHTHTHPHPQEVDFYACFCMFFTVVSNYVSLLLLMGENCFPVLHLSHLISHFRLFVECHFTFVVLSMQRTVLSSIWHQVVLFSFSFSFGIVLCTVGNYFFIEYFFLFLSSHFFSVHVNILSYFKVCLCAHDCVCMCACVCVCVCACMCVVLTLF